MNESSLYVLAYFGLGLLLIAWEAVRTDWTELQASAEEGMHAIGAPPSALPFAARAVATLVFLLWPLALICRIATRSHRRPS